MPTFTYTAKSIDGKVQSGTKDANNREELAHVLRGQGYLLTTVQEEVEGSAVGKLFERMRGFKGVALVDKIMFTRNLAVMIGAGLALNRALSVLQEQVENNTFKVMIGDIAHGVQGGRPFSECIEKHPSAFSELYVNMVRIGETAGNLEQVLNGLADQMKKDHDIISRVKGALMYPAVIFVVMLIVGYLMMVLVVPKLADTFRDIGAELPASTKFLILLSDIMLNYWYVAIAGVIGCVWGLRFALKTEGGKRGFDAVVLKMPVIKGLSKKMNSARMCRTLGILVDSGVPIVKALDILSHTLSNHFFSESLSRASAEIQKGKSLYESLKSYRTLYPPLVTQMIAVGEETGSLTKVLSKLADFYEDEVNNATKNLSTIIEPVMMVIIGAGVGFFALSMITPMYSVLDNI
ncbi:type II secretion system F family protein [Candidatus Azambacteria bacterium]|nr:type II secretion system F family protein [Candidatus Azambacteria bacterium]MBI3684923.1 type II secretion system F family protein [Candidatus Azambacteria bacterium]